jgi:hypothetical protein
MIAALLLDRLKEFMKLYETFTALMKTLPEEEPSADIDTPHFWYSQAQKIWKKEIVNKSETIAS